MQKKVHINTTRAAFNQKSKTNVLSIYKNKCLEPPRWSLGMTERSDWQYKPSFSRYDCAPRSQDLQQSYALLNSLIKGVGTEPLPPLGDKAGEKGEGRLQKWSLVNREGEPYSLDPPIFYSTVCSFQEKAQHHLPLGLSLGLRFSR